MKDMGDLNVIAVKKIKELLNELPKDARLETALSTYYESYTIEELMEIIMEVLEGKGYACSSYSS